MKTFFRFRDSLCAAALLGALPPVTAQADFSGFGTFDNFSININDGGAQPVKNNGAIVLTNGSQEARAIFNTTQQNVTSFSTSFNYQLSSEPGGFAGGLSLILENTDEGSGFVGGPLTSLGYFGSGSTTGSSVAITLAASKQTASGLNETGLYMNESSSTGVISPSPVSFSTNDLMAVGLDYNGTTLHETIRDTVTNELFTQDFAVDIPSSLNSDTGYVGISIGTGFVGQTITISNFSFNTVPEPASLSLLAMGGLTLLARRRHR